MTTSFASDLSFADTVTILVIESIKMNFFFKYYNISNYLSSMIKMSVNELK